MNPSKHPRNVGAIEGGVKLRFAPFHTVTPNGIPIIVVEAIPIKRFAGTLSTTRIDVIISPISATSGAKDPFRSLIR